MRCVLNKILGYPPMSQAKWIRRGRVNEKSTTCTSDSVCCSVEKKTVVLSIKTCACAVGWPRKKEHKDLGCAVLYLSVFPCTHLNIEGITFIPKNAQREKNRKSLTKAQKAPGLGLLRVHLVAGTQIERSCRKSARPRENPMSGDIFHFSGLACFRVRAQGRAPNVHTPPRSLTATLT